MFCEQKSNSSLEHVIPKAIGNNSFTTNNVCKDCNSELGEKIDSKFLNCLPIKMKREALCLEGYKGSIPQVLKEGKDSSGDTIKFYRDSGPKYLTKLARKDNVLSVLASTKDEAATMVSKNMKRNQIPEEFIDSSINKIQTAEVELVRPEISFSSDFNVSHIKLEFLKIAFEYMNIYYGDKYKRDPIGNTLKNILNQYKSGNEVDFDYFILDTPSLRENVNKSSDLNYHQILPIITCENRLFISIFLFNREISYSVLVSDDGKTYPKIIDNMKTIVVNQ